MWLSGRLLGAMLVIALLSACGYQLSAHAPITLPQDKTLLFLNKVTNPTTETWMEPMLRSSIRDELTRRGKVKWVGRDEAQGTVNVDVRQYSTADSVKAEDDITYKSRATVTLEVSFFDADTNMLIWTSGPVTAFESFRASNAKRQATQDAVDQAMRIVADRLSQKF